MVMKTGNGANIPAVLVLKERIVLQVILVIITKQCGRISVLVW